MKFIFYRTSLLVMYEDNDNYCTFFACIVDINNCFTKSLYRYLKT